jgi:multimeric flavodoxin WrbA
LTRIKILGISGSPKKGGNCEQCLSESLKASQTVGDVETELISLAGLQVNPCNGCLRCHFKASRERPCPEFDDGMTTLYPKLINSDGFIFASPVYFGSVSALMKAFMDRLLPFTTAYYYPESEFKETLRFKPAGAIAVGGARSDGVEGTLYSFHRFFLYHDMITVGAQTVGNIYGVSALGGAVVTEDKPNAVDRDRSGMATVKVIGEKVAMLAKAFKPVRPTLE